jgi:hypothetical protein
MLWTTNAWVTPEEFQISDGKWQIAVLADLQFSICNPQSAIVSPSAVPLHWGILGSARIATSQVIPALQHGEKHRVIAIASRDLARAAATARALGIPRSYGSYDIPATPTGRDLQPASRTTCTCPGPSRRSKLKHGLRETDRLGMGRRRERGMDAHGGREIRCGHLVCSHPQWLTARDLVSAGRTVAILDHRPFQLQLPRPIGCAAA